jgi:uncharacterized protein (TIGR00369 family)
MNIPIKNPFKVQSNSEEFNCFGCSSSNEIGLQMAFFDCGNSIEAYWMPKKHFEGFQNVLHGGVQASLLDEIAAWVVFVKCETAGVTKALDIRYHAPVYISDGKLRLVGKIIKTEEKLAVIHSELYNIDKKLCAEARIEYYIFPLAVAKRKYMYPGVEAFY